AVLAWQRADRLALPLGDAVHHELSERAVVVGHAERRVPGARERAYRAHDDLEHVADRQFPGDREHGRADPAEDLVLAGRVTGHRGAVFAHDTTLPARAAARIGRRS